MASITKRGKRWRAMIRRKGVSASQTFPTRYEAQAWAAEQEDRISRGLTGKASNRPFGDALERFRLEVSPNRNGAKWERLRLLALESDPIARIPLCDLGPADFADWRDRRSREVSAWSVDREMTILRTVIERGRLCDCCAGKLHIFRSCPTGFTFAFNPP